MPLNDNHHYILSYYRTSEISGALFFGRLSKILPPGPIQVDMTKHFADEAAHAYYWTDAIQRLGREPLKLRDSYQDQYNDAIGIPTNVMEVLAITQVFERRVINAYARHERMPNLDPIVKETINRIMDDEKWHIEWIKNALKSLEPEYGKDHIDQTIKRYLLADKEIYAKTMQELEERYDDLLKGKM
jgi:bacterioferritin (cytochrome b1)